MYAKSSKNQIILDCRLRSLLAFIAVQHLRVSAFFSFFFSIAFSLWKCSDFVVALKRHGDILAILPQMTVGGWGGWWDVTALCLLFLRCRWALPGGPLCCPFFPRGIHCAGLIHASLKFRACSKTPTSRGRKGSSRPPTPPPARNTAFVLCLPLQIARLPTT